MVFNRNLYLQKLIAADGNGMIKIITGIRRCGKSFLLFELFKNYLLEQGIQANHIIQINLEDRRNKRLRNPDMLLGFRQIENSHMMENVLYNELCSRGYSVDVGLVEIWEKGADGKNKHKKLEVDYVINRGSQRIYIQSAYMMSDADKVAQEQRPLMKIEDSFRKVIISGDYGGKFYNNDGVLRIGVFDFLFDTKCLNE